MVRVLVAEKVATGGAMVVAEEMRVEEVGAGARRVGGVVGEEVVTRRVVEEVAQAEMAEEAEKEGV